MESRGSDSVVCRTWSARKSCRFGDRCKFLHNILNKTVKDSDDSCDQENDFNENNGQEKIQCVFFALSGHCIDGDHCAFLHGEPTKPESFNLKKGGGPRAKKESMKTDGDVTTQSVQPQRRREPVARKQPKTKQEKKAKHQQPPISVHKEERVIAPKEKVTAPKEKVTAPKENVTAPKEKVDASKKQVVARQKKVIAPKDKDDTPKEKVAAKEQRKEKNVSPPKQQPKTKTVLENVVEPNQQQAIGNVFGVVANHSGNPIYGYAIEPRLRFGQAGEAHVAYNHVLDQVCVSRDNHVSVFSLETERKVRGVDLPFKAGVVAFEPARGLWFVQGEDRLVYLANGKDPKTYCHLVEPLAILINKMQFARGQIHVTLDYYGALAFGFPNMLSIECTHVQDGPVGKESYKDMILVPGHDSAVVLVDSKNKVFVAGSHTDLSTNLVEVHMRSAVPESIYVAVSPKGLGLILWEAMDCTWHLDLFSPTQVLETGNGFCPYSQPVRFSAPFSRIYAVFVDSLRDNLCVVVERDGMIEVDATSATPFGQEKAKELYSRGAKDFSQEFVYPDAGVPEGARPVPQEGKVERSKRSINKKPRAQQQRRATTNNNKQHNVVRPKPKESQRQAQPGKKKNNKKKTQQTKQTQALQRQEQEQEKLETSKQPDNMERSQPTKKQQQQEQEKLETSKQPDNMERSQPTEKQEQQQHDNEEEARKVEEIDKLIRRGLAHGKAKKWDQALLEFEKAVKIDEHDPKPRRFVAEALLKLRKEDRAIEAYQKTIELDPDNLDFHAKVANIFVCLGNEEGGVELMKSLCEKDPLFKSDLVELENAMKERERLEKVAINMLMNDPCGCWKYVDNALKKFPNSANLLSLKQRMRNFEHARNMQTIKQSVTKYAKASGTPPRYVLNEAQINQSVSFFSENLPFAILAATFLLKSFPGNNLGSLAILQRVLDSEEADVAMKKAVGTLLNFVQNTHTTMSAFKPGTEILEHQLAPILAGLDAVKKDAGVGNLLGSGFDLGAFEAEIFAFYGWMLLESDQQMAMKYCKKAIALDERNLIGNFGIAKLEDDNLIFCIEACKRAKNGKYQYSNNPEIKRRLYGLKEDLRDARADRCCVDPDFVMMNRCGSCGFKDWNSFYMDDRYCPYCGEIFLGQESDEDDEADDEDDYFDWFFFGGGGPRFRHETPDNTYGSECLYSVLELEKKESSSAVEIKQAFRMLSRKYHPDKHADKPKKEQEAMTAKFQKVNNAYQVLSDPDAKEEYDRRHDQGEEVDLDDLFAMFSMMQRHGGGEFHFF